MTIVFVCECGARVRAPGATPGRTGRCPRCGATLQVSSSEKPAVTEPVVASATGYALRREPDERPHAPNRPAPPASPARHPGPEKSPPRPTRRSEPRFRQSLDYPFRDSIGWILLTVYPLLCFVPVVFSFGLRDYMELNVLMDPNPEALQAKVPGMGALLLAFPMCFLLMLVMGSGLRYLEQVLESSIAAEAIPPHWTRGNLFESLASVLRWVAATGLGLIVGGLLSWLAWKLVGDPVLPTQPGWVSALTWLLFGLGAGLWPMPILAVTLHRDIRAANPFTVLGATVRAGRGALGMGLLFALTGTLTTFLVFLVYQLQAVGILAVVLGLYTLLVLFWYEAMILTRRLGLFYRQKAKAIGWFGEG